MTDLEEAKAYLAAVAEGLGKHSIPAELPSCLREIARNIHSLAARAERHLLVVEEIDDWP